MSQWGPRRTATPELHARTVAGTTYVCLTGDFDAAAVPQVERVCRWTLETAPGDVVIDLAGVGSMHEACVRTLDRLLVAARHRLGDVPVVVGAREVRAAMAEHGFDREHVVVPSLPAALAVLGGFEGDLG